MSNDDLQQLLGELGDRLHGAELDEQTRQLLQELDADIRSVLSDSEKNPEPGTVVETAQLLEARFANEHPLAERVIREVMDVLAKMGV